MRKRYAGLILLVFAASCKPREQSRLVADDQPLTAAEEDICKNPEALFNSDPRLKFNWQTSKFLLQNAYWLTRLSTLIYKDKPEVLEQLRHWGFKNDEGLNYKLMFLEESASAKLSPVFGGMTIKYAHTHAVWAERPEGVFIAFRGTDVVDMATVYTDLRKTLFQTRTLGRVHTGFWSALEIVWADMYKRILQLQHHDLEDKFAKLNAIAALPEEQWSDELAEITQWKIPVAGKINFLKLWKLYEMPDAETKIPNSEDAIAGKREDLLRFLNQKWLSTQKPIWITGHSLGGGLAQIAATRLLTRGFNVQGLYIYGSPRAGDDEFAHKFEVAAYEKGIRENAVRFVNENDVVARIPPLLGLAGSDYREIGRLKYISPSETGMTQILTSSEDLNDYANYTSGLPLEQIKKWIKHHDVEAYLGHLEKIVFGKVICGKI